VIEWLSSGVTPVTPAPVLQPAQAPVWTGTVPTLEALLEEYGPEKVLEANGGNIPASDTELAAVVAKLEAW